MCYIAIAYFFYPTLIKLINLIKNYLGRLLHAVFMYTYRNVCFCTTILFNFTVYVSKKMEERLRVYTSIIMLRDQKTDSLIQIRSVIDKAEIQTNHDIVSVFICASKNCYKMKRTIYIPV